MRLRARLTLIFTVVSVVCVIGVSAFTLFVATRNFEQIDRNAAQSAVNQVNRQLALRGEALLRSAEQIASSETAQRVAADRDDAAHTRDAETIAATAGLDYVELLRPDGTIVSSAHWPAHYGYNESKLLGTTDRPVISRIETPGGDDLALMVVRRAGEILLVAVGTSLKADLSELSSNNSVDVWLYDTTSKSLLAGSIASSRMTQQILQKWLDAGGASHSDGERTYYLLPLSGGKRTDAYLVLGRSLAAQRSFSRGLLVAALGSIVLAIVLSWILGSFVARRLSEPLETLAEAAERVATGDWQQRVELASKDEIGQLAGSFNQMTAQLASQRDRLVQVERVAAWRELARRLAHELKNPLFPLQLTVETLEKAREMDSPEMDEIFRESTRTLREEIANLRNIVDRFSDFSKMPAPEIQNVDLNRALAEAAKLHAAQGENEKRRIKFVLDLTSKAPVIAADPLLVRRVIDNLVLNAMDAMPSGGTLTLRSSVERGVGRFSVIDTGEGLTPEECERLFTPYYTTKKHGTGLGLAIVQSIVSDHRGRVQVQSEKREGTTFTVEIPLAPATAAQV
jgi:nitrogen fixation/metabolism regulation signal transduction histidine kinase